MNKDTKRMLFYIATILLGFALFDYIGKPDPKYKINECAKDQIHNDLRKVTKVGRYIYNYCKIRDNECGRGYSMRIKDFDRIMVKSDCKGASDE